ncbi:50S ribosomal protein L6 [Pontibacter sp. G13]|uniref:50S ribosomal protein L6 n=1 Tax=Pontibacter sp. G13 TaxID=3074898 RepID=UPI002889C609|nr:50S ribosomal protein L6 [Pontibacter sp. G13]WNJ16532.1 50S ribosomal protein L6 [Pontibacter sp. G13]
MSRIGKLPITLPAGVSVTVDKSNIVTVKGPKGELKRNVDADISVEVADGLIHVKRPTEQKRHKAMHGLYRTLISNMVEGVAKGFEKKMQVVGVGYKAEAKGQTLELSLGFSHPIVMVLPSEVKAETETKRGEAPLITLTSADKELLGQIAAKIRGFRPPEPYKGKGIRFLGEVIRRKAGKAAGK